MKKKVNVRVLSRSYAEERKIADADFQNLLTYILKYCDMRGLFLDVGCGIGTFLLPLASRFMKTEFFGLDLERSMLEQAKGISRTCDNVGLLFADGEHLPFMDKSFSTILLSQVIHYFVDPERAVSEVARVSADESSVLVVSCSHDQMRGTIDVVNFPGALESDLKRVPDTIEIKKIFEKEGFKLAATVELAWPRRVDSYRELVNKVKKKAYSTYTVLSEEEFREGLEVFERELIKRYGDGEIAYFFYQTLMVFKKHPSYAV